MEAVKFKPIEGYTVIAVNNAINITKDYTDYWFTLDPSEDNISIMRKRPYDAYYFCAIPDWYGTNNAPIHRCKVAVTGIHYLKRIQDDSNALKIKYGLSDDKSCIHTGNSAYGALNLAFHMEPSEIIILGVNGNRLNPKFDNRHCVGDLSHLPKLFESAKNTLDTNGIRVYNANRETLVKCFEYTDIFD